MPNPQRSLSLRSPWVRSRSPWQEGRSPEAPRRVWRDWVLVAVLVPAVVLEGLLRPELTWRAFSTVLVAGLVTTLLWRRTHPLLMVAIAFGLTALALWVIGGPLQLHSLAFLIILPYALFRWGTGREAVIGMAIIVANDLLSWFWQYPGAGDAIAGLAILSLAAALGAALRYRARARLRELDQAKLLERERLARDLHDTVAHHVSAMAIRAQAGLATADTHPDAAVEALRVIEAEASRALAEMRTMVRVLRRDEPADLAPARGSPTSNSWPAPPGPDRRSTWRSSATSTTSPPSVGRRDLPPRPGVRHQRPAARPARDPHRGPRRRPTQGAVRLRVSDDGDPAEARTPASRGYGLIGMIERADLLGGTFEAGPNPGRGWTVTAVLPRRYAGVSIRVHRRRRPGDRPHRARR